MSAFKNLTGLKFNKLTVISLVPEERVNGGVRWNCICDCGATKVAAAANLKRGTVKSCGCAKRYPRIPKEHQKTRAILRLYKKYKHNAEIRKLSFNISLDQFSDFILNNCYYCNSEPSQKPRTTTIIPPFLYNGLDRLDNSKGYETNNIVPCCGVCNTLKMDYPLEVFKSKIIAIYNHYIKNDNGKT